MNNRTKFILDEVQKAIVGKEDVVRKALMAIIANGHILLEDIPGVGKTTMALSFSRALDLDYKRIQCTPDITPSDIVGFSVYRKENDSLEYKPGVVMCNLLLADEINRASSKTQSALLEVMEERNTTVDGHTRPLPNPFIVIATQNPVGSAGTQLLPASQVDRFMVRLQMGYPDFQSNVEILRDRQTRQPLDSIIQVSDRQSLVQMQKEAEQIHVKDDILIYITSLVEQTRHNDSIILGVSPRGALALSRIAKASAYINGRDYVIPDDVIDVFADVCAHRLTLSPKTKLSNIAAEDILNSILNNTKQPVIRA